MKKKISIVTATFNEEQNIEKLCQDIYNVMLNLNYEYEHLIIDNNSSDNTQNIIRQLCKNDKNIKAIFNLKNFGHTRSPYYGILQSSGDATVLIAADFQDPIELIPELINKWNSGSKVVFLKRNRPKEISFTEIIKIFFYKFLYLISDAKLIERATGSGIYDKSIICEIKKLKESDPYLRGIVTEFVEDIEVITFNQPKRIHGRSKNNFYTLFDLAINAIVKHSKLPLRIITIGSFISSTLSLMIGIFFLVYKILYWDKFQIGMAPILVGVFFGISILIFLLGIIGEYVYAILKETRSIPLVIEKERINFDHTKLK
jgi:glycosyltransferase involved in cell wall biosynthesis